MDPKQAAALLKQIMAGIGGAITGAVQNAVPGRPDLRPIPGGGAADEIGQIYRQNDDGTWSHYASYGSLAANQMAILGISANRDVYVETWTQNGTRYGRKADGTVEVIVGGSESGGGGAGGTAEDPLVEQVRQQQLLSAQGAEARAQEMQPYDIAQAQAATEASKATVDIGYQNLARQKLQDDFTRAYDAFQASNLADQLAQEKQKTATTLLSSIVDALVPNTASPIGPYPVVGNLNWSAVTGGANPQTSQLLQQVISGLNPQTDQATQYLSQQQGV
jgi:hypothetical protein